MCLKASLAESVALRSYHVSSMMYSILLLPLLQAPRDPHHPQSVISLDYIHALAISQQQSTQFRYMQGSLKQIMRHATVCTTLIEAA